MLHTEATDNELVKTAVMPKGVEHSSTVTMSGGCHEGENSSDAERR